MNKAKLKRMTGIALLMALVVVMQAIGSAIPPVSGFSISLVLIPIVLGAALYGPSAGLLLGTTFGVVVFINCVTGADVGGHMVFQAGPFLCFLVVIGKGALAGFASGLVYKLMAKRNGYLAMLFAAIICPVVNTGTFVACMLLFFREVLAAWAGGTDLLTYIFSGLLLMNFVPELIINILFSPAGQRITHIVNKR
jgi:uncharacterized membrane protein